MSLRGASLAVCLAAAALAAVGGCGGGGNSQARPAPGGDTASRARLDAALADAAATTFPGVVALIRTPEGEWQGAAGFSDLEARRPAVKDDRFAIASITKTFVAAAAAQLASEGRLSLEDRVVRWLPDVDGDVRRATVRQLLNHTSGVSDGSGSSLVFPPGGGWNYSDGAYALAGLIVERAAGKPLADVLRERILEPLELNATTYGATGPRMRGYSGNADVTTDDSDPGPEGAAGAIVSNAPDLARFFEALLGGELLEADALAAMGYVVHVRADESGRRVFVLAANSGEPVLLRTLGPMVIKAFCEGP